MKLDKEIIKYFKKWQQETGTCPELNIEEVKFESKLLDELCEFPSLTRVSGKVDLTKEAYFLLSVEQRKEYFPLVSGTVENNQISGYVKGSRISENSLSPCDSISWTRINAKKFFIQRDPVVTNDDSFILVPKNKEDLTFIWNSLVSSMANSEFNWTNKAGKEKVKKLKINWALNQKDRFCLNEFIEYYKTKFDAYRQLISAIRSSIESFDKAFLPAIFSSEKEPFIVEKFNTWAEGRGYEFRFDEIDFFDAFPFDDELSVKLIGAKKLGKHEELEVINDDNGLPVYDASHSILTYVAENKFPSLVFKVLDESNPDISFASEGNSSAGTNLFIHHGKYFVNNHRTVITFLDKKFYSKYVYYRLLNMKQEYGFQRGYIPSQSELKKLKIAISIPTGVDSFNIQQIIVEFIEHWQDWKAEIFKRIDELESNINLTEETLIAKVFKGAEE